MTTITLEAVLEQARQLNPEEQERLVKALRSSDATSSGNAALASEDEDLAEQQATWAYLQQALNCGQTLL